MKLLDNEIKLEVPRHQQWAMHIFHKIRSDLIPDYIGKLKIAEHVNESVLLEVTKKQLSNHKYNDAALMIVRYKFHKEFNLLDLVLRLVDMSKIETAKMLIAQDDKLKIEMIRALSNNDNCKRAA